MNVLLSEFSCDPTKGSDAGLGWRWAETLAGLGHNVWVITRTIYRAQIEEELAKSPAAGNLHFHYYDCESLPGRYFRRWRKAYVYYYFWQFGAFRQAKKMHNKECFSLVHHLTWVSARLPSFMGWLGVPFIFGPVAGGESAPIPLRSGYSLRAWLKDAMRDLSNAAARVDPLMQLTFAKASRIYVTSLQTLKMVNPLFRGKASVQLAIAFDPRELGEEVKSRQEGRSSSKILYVGRFLEWKGMHLGLPAFAKFAKENPESRLTMIGTGPAEQRWRRLADRLGISRNIDWIPWLDRRDLTKYYQSHDVFLFPSLHDSGGLVILEALSNGLPVVCLDVGGPGVLVDTSCGVVVSTVRQRMSDVIDGLSDALAHVTFPSVCESLRTNAIQRSRKFTWDSLVERVYDAQSGTTSI